MSSSKRSRAVRSVAIWCGVCFATNMILTVALVTTAWNPGITGVFIAPFVASLNQHRRVLRGRTTA